MRERSTVDITANGGGEGSATGNTLVYTMPSSPTKSTLFGKVVGLVITNQTGVSGDFMMMDSITTTDVMTAISAFRMNINATETVILDEKDMDSTGIAFIKTGLVAQASNGATSNGWKVTAVVDVF